MTPTIEQITGMESAYTHAKSLKPYSNMGVSAGLIIDMRDTILTLHAEIAAKAAEIERLHSLIIGLINCGDSLISTKGKPHFEDYAYADWKGIRKKANATLASSLTREQ